MKKTVFVFCALLILVCYMAHRADAAAMRACTGSQACFNEHLQKAESGTTVTASEALLEDQEEQVSSDAQAGKRRRIISIEKPPKVEMSQSSIRIGDSCYLGCAWFYLQSTKESICSNCPTLIAYNPQADKTPKAKNQKPDAPACFNLPADIRNGRIPANFTNYAKDLCSKTCTCTATVIDEKNSPEVQVHRAKAFAILTTMMNWITNAIEKYYKGVNKKLGSLRATKSKRCNERRKNVLASQNVVVKNLRASAESTRQVMAIGVEKINGKDAQKFFNEFIKLFNEKSHTLHEIMKKQANQFAGSLGNLCIRDKIASRRNDAKEARKEKKEKKAEKKKQANEKKQVKNNKKAKKNDKKKDQKKKDSKKK